MNQTVKKINQISFVSIEDQASGLRPRGKTPEPCGAAEAGASLEDSLMQKQMYGQLLANRTAIGQPGRSPNSIKAQTSMTQNATTPNSAGLGRAGALGKSPTLTRSVIRSQQSQLTTEASNRAPMITDDDIGAELPEPKHSELNQANQQISVILDLSQPVRTKIKKDIFQCAEYWLSKGFYA